MDQIIPIKKVPDATPEIAGMLGMEHVDNHEPELHATPSLGDLPIANLPMVEVQHQAEEKPAVHTHVIDEKLKHLKELGTQEQDEKPKASVMLKIAKGTLPYALIFIVGLFLYYFFFSGFDITGIFKTQTKVSTPKDSALQSLEKQDLTAYYKWVQGFYYEVTDAKVIDPDADNSGNGLSNFQKYLLNLNPKSYDTLGLGQPDSQTLAMGINPLTGGSLNDAQKKVVDQYVDMEVVMNRLTLANLQSPHQQVAGVGVNSNGTIFNQPDPAFGTQTQTQAQTSGSNYLNPATDNNLDLNTDIAGRLEIPSLKINVPIIWSKDTNSFDKDLQSGVVHYPGTALPGQIGTTYISGHSSNYVWAKGSYNQVFSKLGDLADNTSLKVTVVQKNGKDAIFHYVVTSRKQYLPTDPEQFRNSGKSVIALSTCWPVGSTAKRLVVFAELTQVEK